MPDSIDPERVASALDRLARDLPVLVGEKEWAAVGDRLRAQIELLQRSTDQGERLKLAMALIKELAPYPNARTRLWAEINAPDVEWSLESDLAAWVSEVASNVGLDASRVTPLVAQALQLITISDAQQTRRITLHEGGLGGGKSIKLKNLHLDLNQMTTVALGVTTTAGNIMDKPQPLVIAAGVLLTIRSLTDAMTVQISERDASVFWGLVQARHEDNTAPESAIVKHANTARQEIGLDPLEPDQVRNALHVLAQLKAVEAVPEKRNTWRILEKYKIAS